MILCITYIGCFSLAILAATALHLLSLHKSRGENLFITDLDLFDNNLSKMEFH